jgi:hypothetical protein
MLIAFRSGVDVKRRLCLGGGGLGRNQPKQGWKADAILHNI